MPATQQGTSIPVDEEMGLGVAEGAVVGLGGAATVAVADGAGDGLVTSVVAVAPRPPAPVGLGDWIGVTGRVGSMGLAVSTAAGGVLVAVTVAVPAILVAAGVLVAVPAILVAAGVTVNGGGCVGGGWVAGGWVGDPGGRVGVLVGIVCREAHCAGIAQVPPPLLSNARASPTPRIAMSSRSTSLSRWKKSLKAGLRPARCALGCRPVRPGPGRPPRSTNFHLLSIILRGMGNLPRK